MERQYTALCLNCGFVFGFKKHLYGNEHFWCPVCGSRVISITEED